MCSLTLTVDFIKKTSLVFMQKRDENVGARITAANHMLLENENRAFVNCFLCKLLCKGKSIVTRYSCQQFHVRFHVNYYLIFQNEDALEMKSPALLYNVLEAKKSLNSLGRLNHRNKYASELTKISFRFKPSKRK